MVDREKVIKGLTECIHLYEYPDDWDTAGCVACPYRPNGKGTCDTTIPIQPLKDALELLKEQEPVCTEYAGSIVLFSCRECKSMLHFGQRYCSMCGRKVKWDAETSS